MLRFKSEFLDRMFMYPHDATYIRGLADNLHLPLSKLESLSSVVGGQEIADVLAMSAEKDFGSYFSHIPQKEKVSDFLRILKQVKMKKDPDSLFQKKTFFLIAEDLTVHQQILKAVAEDAKKYASVRFVLALPLKASFIDYSYMKEPVFFDVLYCAVNPFDKLLIDFPKETAFPIRDLVDLKNQAEFGFLVVQHPQTIAISDFLTDDYKWHHTNFGQSAMISLLEMFKNIGVRGWETYPNTKPSNEEEKQWYQMFISFADHYGMLKLGDIS